MNNKRPSLPPEITAVLHMLLSNVQAILADRLIGMYVHGSLACGDFDPHRSDIDFLAVTAGELPTRLLAALAAMHARFTSSGIAWAQKLEGSYIPQQALHRYDPAQNRHPALQVGGRFGIEPHGPDWVVQRHVLREHGIVLAGPPLATLIDPVSPAELQQAVRGTLREWWSPPFAEPERFKSREYQAYAVLTMCRALYTLQYGAVVSKPIAARWALASLDKQWSPLIARALAWPREPQPDYLDETVRFILFSIDKSKVDKPHIGEG